MITRFVSYTLTLLFVASACNFSGIQDGDDPKSSTTLQEDELPQVQDSLLLDKGVVIKFLKQGQGDSIRKGDIVMIDYACRLKDGKVFDTNEKIGKPIPFMVGWSMQTKGWDLAFTNLRVGDHVQIYLPADMARGKLGIKGLVPPDAENWITVKIVSKKTADLDIDGVQMFIFERDKNPKKIKIGDELELDYMAYSESKPRYSSSFENGSPFKFKVGSGSNLPGLNMAMENAYYNDMLWVLIPPKYAFGTKGSVDNVKPNEFVLFDLLISEPEP